MCARLLCVKLNGKKYSLPDFITQKSALKNGNERKNLHLKVYARERKRHAMWRREKRGSDETGSRAGVFVMNLGQGRNVAQ